MPTKSSIQIRRLTFIEFEVAEAANRSSNGMLRRLGNQTNGLQ